MLFSGLKGMRAVNKIKSGQHAQISYAAVAMLIINLSDAKAKLSSQTYKQIEDLFMAFQKDNTMHDVDLFGYYEICKNIISQFDRIAPYELYSGGNQQEFSALMKELRHEKTNRAVVNPKCLNMVFDESQLDEQYIRSLLNDNPEITREDAVAFNRIILLYHKMGKGEKGKSAVINRLFRLVDTIAEKDPARAIIVCSFFCGALVPNEILSKGESEKLSKRFTNLLLKAYFSDSIQKENAE